MKCIENYSPPTPRDLANLKYKLGFTSEQMARLAGLAQGGQWRKYTGTLNPRVRGQHMHFYMAALLTLQPEQLERIYACMQEHGASLETGELLLPRIR